MAQTNCWATKGVDIRRPYAPDCVCQVHLVPRIRTSSVSGRWAAAVGGGGVLTVENFGPGIAKRDGEEPSSAFVRLDDARDLDTGGSGLGLAIVSDLVAAHGGHVWCLDSAVGGVIMEVALTSMKGEAGLPDT